MVESCDICQRFRPRQQKETLRSDDSASRPFESISADLFEYGSVHFMVVMDRYSSWPIVIKYGKMPNSTRVIMEFRKIFRDFGFPLIIRTDGGTQFSSKEFQDFCADHSIKSVLSSAHYPQLNGHAEAGVKAMKDLVCKHWNGGRLNSDLFDYALLEWRNTPRQDGLTPSQWLFGFIQRTKAPALPSSYQRISETKIIAAEGKIRTNKEKQVNNYNFRARDLRPLNIGETVLICNPNGGWDRRGIITDIRSGHRSYFVQADGRKLLRNRSLLKPCS
jgi:hypothetical protein